jgi:hypothetical protein
MTPAILRRADALERDNRAVMAVVFWRNASDELLAMAEAELLRIRADILRLLDDVETVRSEFVVAAS